jgi:hypothetical protein
MVSQYSVNASTGSWHFVEGFGKYNVPIGFDNDPEQGERNRVVDGVGLSLVDDEFLGSVQSQQLRQGFAGFLLALRAGRESLYTFFINGPTNH